MRMWWGAFKTKLKHILGRPTKVVLDRESDLNGPATPGRSIREKCQSKRCDGSRELFIMVGTWNVAGKLPPSNLDLDKWLNVDFSPDIYVLGFQEIVPLNASNILGVEDRRPAQVWKDVISRTLNKRKHKKSSRLFGGGHLFRSATWAASKGQLKPIQIECKGSRGSQEEEAISSFQLKELKALDPDCNSNHAYDEGATNCNKEFNNDGKSKHHSTMSLSIPTKSSTLTSKGQNNTSIDYTTCDKRRSSYVHVVSEQMGGIHIFIWIRKELKHHIKNISISHVGTGVLGYLGNKGAISVSMNVCGCSYCFVCSHLSAGEKQVDNDQRAMDVMDILKRARFITKPPKRILFWRRNNNYSSPEFPERILEHESIIWFGDLNYRINSISDEDVRYLVSQQEWDALLEKDQLRKEFSKGQIFKGWKEGEISFAPTYKYEVNSDNYNLGGSKGKRRKPAWCDRILWHGEKIKLLSYTRVESILSDHKPVKAILVVNSK